MEAWWDGLTLLNKGFVIAALFFSVLFLWQIISMILGLDADGHGDVSNFDVHGDMGSDIHADVGDMSADGGDAADHAVSHDLGGDVAFSLVSVRSVLAFGMLFSWAGTLYLMSGTHVILALIYSFIWGLIAMFLVSYLIYKLLSMQEVGNVNLFTALGEEARVYYQVPQDGVGTVRVPVSGAISYVKARSMSGEALPAGAKVRVVKLLPNNILGIQRMEETEE